MTLFKPFNPSELQSKKSRSEVRQSLASAQASASDEVVLEEGEDANSDAEATQADQMNVEAAPNSDLATRFVASLGRSGG
ncbi:hypothetical protein [Sphaerothrix gracilis]|uniref:hypothetical protein n=1 Tax=Sphaerothrix gracilis TaxID=3151835 RepID=UPI0031FC371C